MLNTKTKKALCLSLLVSLTASVSAEGWMDTVKSYLTPKTAIAATLAVGAVTGINYWYQNRIRCIATLRVGGRDFSMANTPFYAEKDVVNVYIAPVLSTGFRNERPGLRALRDTTGPTLDKHRAYVTATYTLDNDFKPVRRVIIEQDSVGCPYSDLLHGTTLDANIQNSLGEHIYSHFDENHLKNAYLQKTNEELQRAERELANAQAKVDRLQAIRQQVSGSIASSSNA